MGYQKKIFLSVLLLGPILKCTGQSDTVNFTDSLGFKQGWWIISAGSKKPSQGNYSPEKVYEVGRYFNSKKEGIWTTYWPNGNVRMEIPYEKNRPKGYVKIYHENGNIQEEGHWENNRWTGTYKQYWSNGCVQHVFSYDKSGKKYGEYKYYHQKPCNALWMAGAYQGGRAVGEWTTWDTTGKITEKTDLGDGTVSTIIAPHPVGHRDSLFANEWYVDGSKKSQLKRTKLYDHKGRLWKEGEFKDSILVNGKVYGYNDAGVLIKIMVYMDWMYMGDVPLDRENAPVKMAADPGKKNFDKKDSLLLNLCSCDSLMRMDKSFYINRQPVFNGNGWIRLFNTDKQISKCGYFWKYRLILGYDYRYDKDGKQIQIVKYHNGANAGECPVEGK